MSNNIESSSLIPPDLSGEHYSVVLKRLHENLLPKTYLEVGVDRGDTLKLASCPTIAVDPKFQIGQLEGISQPVLHLYQMTSDLFFETHSPSRIFGQSVEMAFLDGMHRCEYLLRDFLNTEKHCRKNSVIVLHDCLPVEIAMTHRYPGGGNDDMLAPHRAGWWTGDVWRTSLLIKRRRPDIKMTVLNASGTGLVLMTNLDSSNNYFSDNYQSCLDEMFSWKLDEIGIENYHAEMSVVSTHCLEANEDISKSFWL